MAERKKKKSTKSPVTDGRLQFRLPAYHHALLETLAAASGKEPQLIARALLAYLIEVASGRGGDPGLGALVRARLPEILARPEAQARPPGRPKASAAVEADAAIGRIAVLPPDPDTPGRSFHLDLAGGSVTPPVDPHGVSVREAAVERPDPATAIDDVTRLAVALVRDGKLRPPCAVWVDVDGRPDGTTAVKVGVGESRLTVLEAAERAEQHATVERAVRLSEGSASDRPTAVLTADAAATGDEVVARVGRRPG